MAEETDLVDALMPYLYGRFGGIHDTKAGLYGLDIIISREGGYFINEINGCCSGMAGFRQVYGDNRVEEEVFRRLSSLGNVTVNDGTYEKEKERRYYRDHPVRAFLKEAAAGLLRKIIDLGAKSLSESEKKEAFSRFLVRRILKAKGIWSEKTDIDWMFDEVPNVKAVNPPFGKYLGQDSLVWNIVNDYLPHPTVNSYVEESIADNKFLQYLLLKDTDIRDHLPQTTLVGLGAGDRSALETLIEQHDMFVKKPVSARCGQGVRFLGRDGVAGFIGLIGPVSEPTKLGATLRLLTGMMPLYVEDFVERQDFDFEVSMHVVQPFIDSLGVSGPWEYSTVRAIVCNGEFVDAYMRCSNNPRVNLSHDAKAIKFEDRGLKELCERVVSVYNGECAKFAPYDFKSSLYSRWFDEAGWNSRVMRCLHLAEGHFMAALFSLLDAGRLQKY